VDPFLVSVQLLAEVLLDLLNKNFSVGSIRGYRSAISSTLKHFGRDIGNNKDITDLLSSLSVDRPRVTRTMPSWDLRSCCALSPRLRMNRLARLHSSSSASRRSSFLRWPPALVLVKSARSTLTGFTSNQTTRKLCCLLEFVFSRKRSPWRKHRALSGLSPSRLFPMESTT
jgi:hypothetical protein